MNKKMIKTGLTTLALACATLVAQAQSAPATGLADAVQKALDSNPDVTARLNAMRAATNEIDVARGAYLPNVDLSASVGRDQDRITSRNPQSQSLSRNGLALAGHPGKGVRADKQDKRT